jgi:hypothetical protein
LVDGLNGSADKSLREAQRRVSLATGLMVTLTLMLRVRIVPVKLPSSPRVKVPI